MTPPVPKQPAPPSGSSNRACLLLGIIAFALLMLAGIYWNPHLFQNVVPGQNNDDVFYDNLAFNLVRGEGYRLDFDNPEWLGAYIDPVTGVSNNSVVNLEVEGLTATRAPGYPYFLAAVYHEFGRRWDVVYFLQWIIVCSALTTLVVTVCRSFGIVTALLATLTLACDFGVMHTIGQVMSEALATTLACLAFCWLIYTWNRTQDINAVTPGSNQQTTQRFQFGLGRWLVLGVLFGLLILVRANCLAWLLIFVLLLLPWALILIIRGKPAFRFLLPSMVFAITVVAVCIPWGYRNCQVVGRFQPQGTNANIGWVGGYCDATVENRGIWDLATVVACQREVLKTLPIGDEDLAVQEYYMGLYSREKGNQWARENWQLLPRLMLDKGLNHFALINRPVAIVPWLNALLLVGAAIGCWASWRRFGFWVALILFFSTATTMLTWPHHGRYLVPVRPLIHCAAAIGTVYFWYWVFSLRDQTIQARTASE